MLNGRMMDMPLLISSIIDYAADVRSSSEIVSQTVEGNIHRYTYADSHRRTSQLANALKKLGVNEGDRVATLAWNGYRHFELYYAVTGIGAVCHTINPRLFADQIIYVINHAKDRIIFIDQTFVPIVEKLVDRLPNDLIYVILCNKGDMPDTSLPKPLCFEELISSEASTISWPNLDERAASSYAILLGRQVIQRVYYTLTVQYYCTLLACLHLLQMLGLRHLRRFFRLCHYFMQTPGGSHLRCL